MHPDIEGILAIALSLGIPIVAILTSHQRKMAKLFQENALMMMPAQGVDTQALQDELRELKTLVHQQAIALDNLSRPLPTEPRLQDRVVG